MELSCVSHRGIIYSVYDITLITAEIIPFNCLSVANWCKQDSVQRELEIPSLLAMAFVYLLVSILQCINKPDYFDSLCPIRFLFSFNKFRTMSPLAVKKLLKANLLLFASVRFNCRVFLIFHPLYCGIISRHLKFLIIKCHSWSILITFCCWFCRKLVTVITEFQVTSAQ